MELLILGIQLFVVFNLIMGLASLCTWFERKGSALIQDRIGANRAGATFYTEDTAAVLQQVLPGWVVTPLRVAVLPVVLPVVRALGILGVINTLVCDAVKALFKEDFVPEGVSNFLHSLAPFLAVLPVFLSFALIPMSPEFTVGDYTMRIQVASIDAGILFILAMGSVAVYGVAIAGFTGNNKFSLLGGLRAAAQMISYELAMGISMVTMIVVFGTLDLYQMVEWQIANRWGIAAGWFSWLSFIILFIVGMAETKRGPFDLPEAESELAAGYFTEYSGMKFLLFWLGEFAEIALFSLIMTVLFFGGWDPLFFDLNSVPPVVESGLAWLFGIEAGPNAYWTAALLGHVVFMSKVVALSFLQIIIRWTLPRFRYDQLMNLGWKGLLPLSLAVLMLTAASRLG